MNIQTMRMAALCLAVVATPTFAAELTLPKDGWTSWQVPDVLVPSLSLAWAAMLVAAAAIYAAFLAPRPLFRR